MNRRHLLTTIPLLAVAACANQTPAQIAATAVTDAQLIATGLQNFAAASGTAPATAAKIAPYVADALKLAGTLSASMAATQAQPIVQQIAADVTDVAQASAGLVPAGSPAAQILADVQFVMPLLQIAVGLAAPAGAAAGSADAARARLAALPKSG